MKKVSKDRMRAVEPGARELPDQLRLPTEGIAGAIREGLLAMSTVAGLAVLSELLEEEVAALCGPRGRHDPERVAYRHGAERSSLPLGGRKVRVTRPRVRSTENAEIGLESWRTLSARDMLGELALSRMLAGVSTRRYARDGLEPIGNAAEAGSEQIRYAKPV